MPPYASRIARIKGQLGDTVWAVAPTFVTGFFSFLLQVDGVPWAVLIGASLLWSLFYLLFADGLRDGQSLAKRQLGICVIDERTGAPCTFWQSFVRNLCLSFFGPVDWLFIFGEKHQRLGDIFAHTIVVDCAAAAPGMRTANRAA